MGLLAGSISAAFCQDTDSNGRGVECGLAGVLTGAAVGAVTGAIGAMVGSSFHRHPLITDSVIGDHAVVTGLVFAGAGAILGAANGRVGCGSSCTGDMAKGGALSALIGGAIGAGLGSLFPKYFRR